MDSPLSEAQNRPSQGASKGAMATRAIGAAAVIIMLGNLTGSLLGFARQAVIARVFGTSNGTDAFVAASIVPQMFYDLTIGVAVSAALIPTFSEILERKGRDELWRTVSSVLVLAWLVLVAMVIVLIVAAQPLMTLILSGFHASTRPGALQESVRIVRILVLTLFFLGTSAVLLSTLYSLRRFAAPAFATSLYHLGIIAGAVFLARPLGILSLPIGAVAGSAGQVLVQVPALLRHRPRLRLQLELSPDVRRILRLYAPVAAGLLVSLAGQIIDINLKWQLGRGGATAMQFATTLTQFPIGIAVAALSYAVLPSISSDAAFDRMEDFKDTVARGIRLVLFLTIPTAVGYIAIATPIVRLLFEHGRFGALATTHTSLALTGYAVQIPFVGLDQLLIFSFYARKDTVTPMLIGLLGVVIYVASALMLMPRLHILGLALANTMQNSSHACILLILLILSIGTLEHRGILRSVMKSLTAALVMGAGAGVLAFGMEHMFGNHGIAVTALDALFPVALGAGLYLGTSVLLGSQEISAIWRLALRR